MVTLADKEELLAESIAELARWKAEITLAEEQHAAYVARVRSDIAFGEGLNNDLADEIALEKA